MSSRKKPATIQAPIKISPPELVRLVFVRDEAAESVSSWANFQMEFQLGVARFGMHRIGVELQVEIKNLPATECRAAYRASFEIERSQNMADPELIERGLRDIVVLMAPGTLYPFLREAIASMAARASLPPLVLPLVNFRTLFKDMQVMIPAISSDTDAAEETE